MYLRLNLARCFIVVAYIEPSVFLQSVLRQVYLGPMETMASH